MKAITIWQPWATLIMAGAKPYEFRTWPMPRDQVAQRTVIHAGKTMAKMEELLDLMRKLHDPAAGHGLIPELAGPIIEKCLNAHSSSTPLPLSSALGTVMFGTSRRVTDLFRGTRSDNGNLGKDKWAWPVGGIRIFDHPIPCRGAQSLWDFPKELEPAT